MKRRNLILLLGGASSGAMSVGTGAFSSMEAERGVEVNVVGDADAFVQYEIPVSGEAVDPNERTTLVRIQNQFGGNKQIALVGVEIHGDYDVLSDVTAERKLSDHDSSEDTFEKITDVSIELGADASGFPDPDKKEALGPGDGARVVANTGLTSGEKADIEVTITVKGVEGSGVTARIFGDTRRFTIEGSGPDEIDGVRFTRTRSAKAEGASGNYTLDLWFVNEDDKGFENDVTQERSWNGSGNLNSADASQNSDVGNRRLVAVGFQETGQTFYRPDSGIDEGDVPWNVENLAKGEENGNGSENGNANNN